MVAVLYISALILAAFSVSVLGAAFSVSGLARLFSGAALAVTLMAASLEFSKFVVAAFLHRTWNSSMLFPILPARLRRRPERDHEHGYFRLPLRRLSNFFGRSRSDSDQSGCAENRANPQHRRIAHINRSIDEIPASRISKKIQARKDAEPQIQELQKKADLLGEEMKQLELKNLEVKTKVGPLIYVARAFHQDIDTVVKWLILVFVTMFDPLAICLVIATSEALKLKALGRLSSFAHEEQKAFPEVFPEVMGVADPAPAPATAKSVAAPPVPRLRKLKSPNPPKTT